MKVQSVLLLICLFLTACISVDKRQDEALAERYNDLSYRLRYSDISVSLRAAKKAESLSQKGSDGYAEALNNIAYVCYQQMRYDQALYLLRKVHNTSRNQLELLCADVLTMKIMQRIGQGKEFFDSRLFAQKRLQRILSEEKNLTLRQQHRLQYALTEFHIVASTYYYYLGQDSAACREIQDAAQYVNIENDTTQWLYYHYMKGSGGLVEGTPDEVTVTEFDHLFRVYTLAKANHFTYFEANVLQSFASMVSDSLRAREIIRQHPVAYNFLYSEHLHWMCDSLLPSRLQFAAAMAHHAVSLFCQYRDLFQTACALRTLGEVYFSAGQYDEALKSFQSALHLASDHSRSPYYVTPWLASIHENLSLTYSALGDKRLADSHRNTYLDLLDESRQNKEFDSRKALLKQEVQNERLRLIFLLSLVMAVAILSAVYYRQLKRCSRSSEQRVREIASSAAYLQVRQRLDKLLQNREERLEEYREECQVMQQRILQQQERHIIGRTKLSVVYAIIPYLDRVIAEVNKLKGEDDNTSGHLSYIRELCSGIMVINDRLTSWIQMQQGKLKLQVTRFPLSDILRVISMQQYAFSQQQLTLEVTETDFMVKADKPLTLFMVNTLVDNARKFTPVGGKVSVTLQETENYVEVSVCDTGMGLSPEDVQKLNDSKVYDPNHIGASNANKGFGFGIMNCKGIINSYKKLSPFFNVCDFGVESQQGKGSRFWFRLPRVLSLLFLLLFNVYVGAMPQRCYDLYDSIYNANLQGRYADAYYFSENAISIIEEPIDTPLLVSLYNEQAIAAQALAWWDTYRHSNAECVRLHRLYSTDESLASDCQYFEKITADSRVLYVLIVLLLITFLVLFYCVVLRHRLHQRASLNDLYSRLTAVLYAFPENVATMDGELQEITHGLEQSHLWKFVHEIQQTISTALTTVRQTEAAIEEVEDKIQRIRFEHDRLYVMNQILDNSLSTIKHETMYFPSRIEQMTEEMQQQGVNAEMQCNLLDLVVYYRHIYMLLYEQAHRQMEPSTLCIQTLAVSKLFAYAQSHGIACMPTDAFVKGDETLLRLLIDQMSAVLPLTDFTLEAKYHDSMYYIICAIKGQRQKFTQLSELFSPRTERLEFLVMRQIIREHDAFSGHPGLRLVAEDTEYGFRIVFSLLAAK